MTQIPGCVILDDAALEGRNTLRVAARAEILVDVHDVAALPALFELPAFGALPLLVLGEGSNLLFAGDWPGIVLSMATRGIDVLGESGQRTRIRVAAGENWNDFVHWSLARGYRGLENLVLIPGTVGAAPIQNIGAYGVEVAQTIAAVHVWDRHDGHARVLDAASCAFGYRDSLFKREPDRYLITAVDFELARDAPLRLDYAGIRDELATLGDGEPTASRIAEAVARLRTRKLPSPAVIGNAGSFFKNPVVAADLAGALGDAHAGMPAWPSADGMVKLSAAWLIEQAGLKGYRDGAAGISAQHALVLVNHGGATGAALLGVAKHVARTVKDRFGVVLEAEPRIVGKRS